MTLKEIGVRLAMEGFQREDGGAWYPSLVAGMLARTAGMETPSGSKPSEMIGHD
jgi:hypothetical protein